MASTLSLCCTIINGHHVNCYCIMFCFFSSSSVFIHLVSITNKYNTKYTHRQIYPLPVPLKSQYPCILFGVNLLLYNLFMFSMSYCIECLSTSLVVCFYLTTFLFFWIFFFLCNNTNCKIKHHLQQLLNQAFGIYRKEFDYSVTSSSCSLLLFLGCCKKRVSLKCSWICCAVSKEKKWGGWKLFS